MRITSDKLCHIPLQLLSSWVLHASLRQNPLQRFHRITLAHAAGVSSAQEQGPGDSAHHRDQQRGIKDGEEKKAMGGFQEPGMVWNAWKKGYKIGVIASSDHYSTHISYAMVYTPLQTRQAIFESILKRRTYGATDNIVLEFWLGEHFMGEDFGDRESEGPGGKYIHKTAPGKANAEFEYQDNDAGKGQHWYYVRVEQRDGELAWSSPIWVRY